MRHNKKAQSTLEYVIVLAAIVATIIVFATGAFREKLGNALDNVSDEMVNVIDRIHY